MILVSLGLIAMCIAAILWFAQGLWVADGSARQIWNSFLAPIAFVGIIVFTPISIMLLYAFGINSKSTWNGWFGSRVIRNLSRNTSIERNQNPGRSGVEEAYCDAFYFDEELREFASNRVPVSASLFEDCLAVHEELKGVVTCYSYQDAYKVFFGKGLVVMRFKTGTGPRDVCLYTGKMMPEERARLDCFIESRIPSWCRSYKHNIKLINGWGFSKRPIYDMWEHRPTGTSELVFFRTADQQRAYECHGDE